MHEDLVLVLDMFALFGHNVRLYSIHLYIRVNYLVWALGHQPLFYDLRRGGEREREKNQQLTNLLRIAPNRSTTGFQSETNSIQQSAATEFRRKALTIYEIHEGVRQLCTWEMDS